jgi:hypothetical protein
MSSFQLIFLCLAVRRENRPDHNLPGCAYIWSGDGQGGSPWRASVRGEGGP